MNDLMAKMQWKKSLPLGQEILPIFHKIFGEYHHEITHHMFHICCILLRIDDYDKYEKRDFIRKTEKYLEITHGSDHLLYLLSRLVLSSIDRLFPEEKS